MTYYIFEQQLHFGHSFDQESMFLRTMENSNTTTAAEVIS